MFFHLNEQLLWSGNLQSHFELVLSKIYYQRFLKYGAKPEGSFWFSKSRQQGRFKIILDEEKDKSGIPMVKLLYKKSHHSLKTAKLFLEEFGRFLEVVWKLRASS